MLSRRSVITALRPSTLRSAAAADSEAAPAPTSLSSSEADHHRQSRRRIDSNATWHALAPLLPPPLFCVCPMPHSYGALCTALRSRAAPLPLRRIPPCGFPMHHSPTAHLCLTSSPRSYCTSTSSMCPTAPTSPAAVTLEAIAHQMAARYVASPQFTLEDRGPDTVGFFAKCICGYLKGLASSPAHLQRIAACIDLDGATWEEMARRVLVVGGLLLKQGDVELVQPRSIDAVVDQCAAMPENRDVVFLAVMTCSFNLSSLHSPGLPTLGEVVARQAKHVMIERRLLAGTEATASLKTRQLVKAGVLHAPPPAPASPSSNVYDVLRSQVMGSTPAKVVVVSGTSGSGKTVAALEAATRFACDSSNPAVSTLYMLASDIAYISTINGMASEAEKPTRNREVEKAILAAVKEVVKDPPAKRADGQKTTAVLVLDEMGEYANFVRGVCASRPFTAVQQHLNVDQVVVMVVGTGVDVATNDVGSSPHTFERAHVDSKYVSLSLLRGAAGVTRSINEEIGRSAMEGQGGGTAATNGGGALTEPTDDSAAEQKAPASPLEQLLKECEAWSCALERAPRLRATLSDMSHNPRMVAALVEYLNMSATDYRCDPANDLASRLERGVDYALEKFVMLNGLSRLSFHDLLAYFIRAFAMSLDSGAASRLYDRHCELVVRKYGLVADLAEWCTKDAPGVGSAKKERFGDAIKVMCDGKEYVLCLPKGRTKRYEMSPAMAALGFRLFGRRYPEWSGDGFERTLAEYLSWVALASHSGVPIHIPDADPLARLKRVLVSMGLDADGKPWKGDVTLWRVVLEEPVTSVEAAARVLAKRVVASEGRHLVVALNAPLAPFADILIGLVEFNGGAATLRSMVLIQAKHLPGSRGASLRAVLPPDACFRELAKMGCVSHNTTAATALDALETKKLHRCASALGGDSPKIPGTAWFIVLRAPKLKTTTKDDAHPEELLWFDDDTAMAAFSPSSLGKFIVIKKPEIAPLSLRRF